MLWFRKHLTCDEHLHEESQMWMVRNNGGEYADEFIRQNIVAIGWKDVGPLKNLKTREQIIQQVRTTWPEYKPMKAVVSGSQLDKIANVMQIDDRVITYDPSKRIYHIGRIAGVPMHPSASLTASASHNA
jgi:restriction system protein